MKEFKCKDCIHYCVCKDTVAEGNWTDETPIEIKAIFSPKYCDYFCLATDVAPVVHGEWKFWDGWRGNHDQRIEDATCSECGYVHPTVRREHNDKSYKDVLAKLANYCPNCGAYMDGGNSNA